MKRLSYFAEAFLRTSPDSQDFLWIGVLDNKKVLRKIQQFLALNNNPEKLVDKFGMPSKVANLIFLLAEEKLVSKISDVLKKIKILARRVNYSFVDLVYAEEIQNKNMMTIIDILENKLNSKLIIATSEDKTLISGIKLKMQDSVLDLNLKAKIKQFSKQLI